MLHPQKSTTKANSLKIRLSSVDLFGRSFKLNFGDFNPDFKTAKGGILTILMILVVTPIIIIFGRRWLDTSQPTVSVNNIASNRTERYQLREGNIFTGFNLFTGQEFPTVEQSRRYLTIRGERYTRWKDSEGTTREHHSTFPLVGHQKLTHNQNFLSKIVSLGADSLGDASLQLASTHIPDWNTFYQWYIAGTPTQLPFTKMIFKVYPCSLENPADCVNADALAQSQLILSSVYNSMQFTNYSNPVIDGLDTDLTTIFSLNTQAKFTIWFKRNKIYDDVDSLSGSGPKFTFFNIEKIDSTTGTRDLSTHCTEIAIEDGLCQPYITFEVRSSRVETIIERRYYRFFNMVSDVGGMIDIIFYAFTAFYMVYSSRKFQDWVLTQFYGSVIPEEILKNQTSQSAQEPQSTVTTTPIKAKEVVKKSTKKEKHFLRLLKKTDVLNFLQFSQKSFLLSQLGLTKSYQKAFCPMVYFNMMKKRIKIKKKTKTPATMGINEREFSEAYLTLVNLNSKSSQFEQKIRKKFEEALKESDRLDINLLRKELKPSSPSILPKELTKINYEQEEKEAVIVEERPPKTFIDNLEIKKQTKFDSKPQSRSQAKIRLSQNPDQRSHHKIRFKNMRSNPKRFKKNGLLARRMR